MEFRLLGPLEVSAGDGLLPLGGVRQRAVLAVLLLNANRVVAREQLIQDLWGERPPATAVKAVQVQVSQLRKILGDGVLLTRPPGYLLAVPPRTSDLLRFESLVAESRNAGLESASRLLRDALALWRGPALAEFVSEPFAQIEGARLEDIRLVALEERIAADLALGRNGDVIGDLEVAIAENPYRERLRAQLMLALYRSGRQAEALEAFRSTHDALDELGIEPSAELRELERAVLMQDSALGAWSPLVGETPLPERHSVTARPPIVDRERPTDEIQSMMNDAEPKWVRVMRPRIALTSVVVVAAIVVGLAVVAARRDTSEHLPRLAANSIGLIDTGGIKSEHPLGGAPSGIAAGGSAVWVLSDAGGTLSRFAPASDTAQVLTLGGGAGGIAYGAGSVWVTNKDRRELVQINPQTTAIVQNFHVGNSPTGVAVGKDAVWVVNATDGTVSRVSLTDGSVAAPISVGAGLRGIAVGADAVWVVNEGTGQVVRIDPASGTIVEPINVGNGPTGVAVGSDAVWVTSTQDGMVYRIDPRNDHVTNTIRVGGTPSAIAAGTNSIWVASGSDGTITRIDPRTRRPTDKVRLGSSPNALALADDRIWAATVLPLAGRRGGTLRVEYEPSDCRCVDPVSGSNTTDFTVPTLLYDGLVAYRRVAGPGGGNLVPNLARRLPAPADDGRTYTFLLRPSILYADGTPVRASDFRSSIERLVAIAPDSIVSGGIVGVNDCIAHPERRCDLSRAIVTDDRTGTITIHLNTPDPQFLYKLARGEASVVPSRTPRRSARRFSIPGTGPYRIESATSSEVRLVRNPHFFVWSGEARPAGYPDEIHILMPKHGEARVRAVERGSADVVSLLTSGLTPERRKGVFTRYASRLHSDASPATLWWFLNTRVPPFDDPRVRRALNLAIDRRKIAEDFFGGFAVPTCQILPPGFPGYQPYCPYTRHPNRGGAWTAPDLARARGLVAASGTRGMRVRAEAYGGAPVPKDIALYIVSVLRQLGYKSSLRLFSDPAAFHAHINDSRNRVQLGGVGGWLADTLAPFEFFQPILSCAAFKPNSPFNGNVFEYCNQRLEAKMNAAARLQPSEPVRADRTWAGADRAVVDGAVALPYVNPRDTILVSQRVGNYQSHPLYGTLLDQLWVK